MPACANVTPAQARVTRTIDSDYTPGGQVSITLTAVPFSPTPLDVTETLPTGWTVASATASDGVATPTANTVDWVVANLATT